MALRTRKWTQSRYKKIWIYGSGTFASFFILLLGLSFYGVSIETSPDIECLDTCVSYFNITLQEYSLCFGSTFQGLFFEPYVYDYELWVKVNQDSGRQFCTYGRDYFMWEKVDGEEDLYYCPSSTKQDEITTQYQRCDGLSSTKKMCYRKGGEVWLPSEDLAGKCFDRGNKYEFKLVGYKDPRETVKWGIYVQGPDVDPYWVGDPSYGSNQFIIHYG